MKKIIPLLIAMAAVPAHAQLYKWTDAGGKVHYSDRPQDGVNSKELTVQRPAQPAVPAAPAADDWRQRERESRERRMQREQANDDAADAAAREPYNPSMHRSNKPMTDDEVCTRDAQQIAYAEQAKKISFRQGVVATEEERQAVIRQRKENHALLCGPGQRRR
ncbi:DUF4124 domain-containing protein [Pseudoduganella eburnea]|uniref:DUF4124 domain-containing protein n=1 Tax=Massilia eburnea TaxID=1776165 RepID=A0A6L6QB84_9BURK|nr:DUF4124 domain-containing protein [Massilia eburnea]MTW09003.1 DUF4124 domain-containing protein [Massilia eburnea]